jgi:hypothetical protein
VLSSVQNFLDTHGDIKADIRQRNHKALVFGLHRLAVNAQGNVLSYLERAEKARQHCAPYPFPLVRIRADLWWKTFTPAQFDHPLSLREFSVLCAVYAGIGSKPYAKLTHMRIRRLASGCPERDDKRYLSMACDPSSGYITARMVRTTLDVLEANGFFAKFTYNRGECFYSHKLTRAKLEEMVEKRKLRKLQTVACYRSLDQAASKRIKALKMAASAPLRAIA